MIVLLIATSLLACDGASPPPEGAHGGASAAPSATLTPVESPASAEERPEEHLSPPSADDGTQPVEEEPLEELAQAEEPEPVLHPCSSPEPRLVEVSESGGWVETGFGLDLRFVARGSRRTSRDYRGSSLNLFFYDFRSRYDGRVREHHISGGDWRQARNHGGICFRGARRARYARRRLAVDVAPHCDEQGNLVTRGCRGVFGQSGRALPAEER